MRASVPWWVAPPVLLSVAGLACSVALWVSGDVPVDDDGIVIGGVGMTLAFLALSLLVLRQQPGNRIAWMFLVIGTGIGTSSGLLALAELFVDDGHPAGVWLAVVAMPISDLAWPLLWALPHFLPDGRPQRTPFWRFLAWATVGYIVLGTLGSVVGPTVGDLGEGDVGRNPLHWEAAYALLGPSSGIGGTWWVVALIGGGPASLLWRWWRGDDRLRRQIGAFAVGLPLFCALLLLSLALEPPTSTVLGTVALLVLPTSLGVAILRYRLYEIDRLLSRTVSYSLLTAVLVATYWLAVTATTRLLPVSSATAVAFSTLTCAAAFRPVRRRLQRAVDDRLNPARAHGRRELEAFTGRLAHEVTAQQVADDLLEVVQRTVAPRRAGVWLVGPLVQRPAARVLSRTTGP